MIFLYYDIIITVSTHCLDVKVFLLSLKSFIKSLKKNTFLPELIRMHIKKSEKQEKRRLAVKG